MEKERESGTSGAGSACGFSHSIFLIAQNGAG
jgi:hypothetical protein